MAKHKSQVSDLPPIIDSAIWDAARAEIERALVAAAESSDRVEFERVANHVFTDPPGCNEIVGGIIHATFRDHTRRYMPSMHRTGGEVARMCRGYAKSLLKVADAIDLARVRALVEVFEREGRTLP